ncbi:neutral zinc metallopeptidase [Kribbella sp.]|uniref:neutral zinc metallopeptidase n=1 Tax=Kribbella sp. TaxID=1871183 RepID=UPI002D49E4D0|nr:neutral zinc metallopeptidase [Kribbella sp.]HZX08453.1 neutral zinc metallopeptidase [Kribbella sp.]
MSGNQWGPPPGQQYPPQQPQQPWQQGPGYGGTPPPARPPGPGFPGQPFPGPYHGPGQPQQQFGWGAAPGGPRPPKKKGRGPLIAVLVILGVLLIGGTALKAISSALKHASSPTSEPSVTTTYSPTQPTEPTEAPSTRGEPTTTQSTTQPTRPTASRQTTTNTPTTKPGPSDSDLVVKNALYKAGVMSSVHCRESSARPATAAGARANYKNLLGCLNKAWAPMVAKAGGRFRAPHVITFSGSVSSPCGTHMDSNPPFFCGTNDTIYMNLTEDMGNYNRYSQSYQKIWARMWMLHQMAHEYGHHVQNNMGILQAYSRIRYDRPNYAMELQDSRRLELQASCFSDIFIGANKNSYPVTGQAQYQWRWLIGHTTDLNNDHGDANNHQYWALRGYNARDPRACITWSASAAKVQ